MNCLLLSEGNPSTYALVPLSSHFLKDSTQAISISPASSIFFLRDYFHCHIVVILKKKIIFLWLPPHISASLYSKILGKGFLLLYTVPPLSFPLELTLAGLFFTSLNCSHLLSLCRCFSVTVSASTVKVFRYPSTAPATLPARRSPTAHGLPTFYTPMMTHKFVSLEPTSSWTPTL